MSGQLIGRGYITIAGLKDGDPARTYVLVPSVESVTKKLDGTLSVNTVSCSVYKVTGSSAYAPTPDHTVTFVRKPDGHNGTLAHPSGTTDTINILANTESVEFELKEGTKVIDRVRVPVLSDATDVNDELDTYKYLKESLAKQGTTIQHGLLLTSLIAVGYTDDNNARHTLAGMNGIYVPTLGGRTPAAWYGGPMVDKFNADGTVNNSLAHGDYATSLIRMDGSFYFANGNIGGETDGSAWFGGQSGLRIDAMGNLTMGNGVKINLADGSEKGIVETLQSLTNFNIGLTSLLAPCDKDGNELVGGWEEASQPDTVNGGIKAKSVKVKVGFWSEGFISALGRGGSGSSSSGGGSGFGLYTDSTWASEPSQTDALGAELGKSLHTRMSALETLSGNFLLTDGANANHSGVSAMIRTLGKASSNVLDSTMLITSDIYGESANPLYYRRPVTALWGYIKSKSDSLYVNKAGDTMTGTLRIDSIRSVDGNDMLGYKPTVMAGVPSSSWGAGTANLPGVIRSNNSSLTHWRNGVGNSTIWDSGNDGSGSGLDADMLDGVHNGNLTADRFNPFGQKITDLDSPDAVDKGITYNLFWADAENKPVKADNANGVLNIFSGLFNTTGRYGGQLAFVNNGRMYYRRWSAGVKSAWNTIAYTSDNVASATKLSDNTAFKAWGQSFFENGKPKQVSGDMTGVGSINGCLEITNPGYMRLQSSSSNPGGDVNLELWRRAYASWRFINSGGNLHVQSNYTDKAGNWYDVITLNYNSGNMSTKGTVTSPKYFNRTTYGGSSWNNGYGAYNAEIVDNNGQTPLIVAYRAGKSPTETGSDRLLSLELLNSGDSFRICMGGSYKVQLDKNGLLIVPAGLKIGDAYITYDSANGGIKITKGLYSESYISAKGAGTPGSGSGGSGFGLITSWDQLTDSNKDTNAVSASLSYGLRSSLDSLGIRVTALEGGSATTVTTSGSGNAVTSLSKNGTVITATKGLTFLTQDGSNGNAAGVSALINKLGIGNSVPADADYFVSQYAGGGTSTTTYYRRPVSTLWSYIKGKADAQYQAKGNYVTTDTQQTISGRKTFASDIALSQGTSISLPGGSSPEKITKSAVCAIHGGTDSATENDANLRFGSWFGIGWYPTISGQTVEHGKNAMWLNVRTGVLTVAGKFVKKGGTASQFLKADGSVDSSTYLLQSSYTAADVLSKMKGVDGTGSGLDADLWDGEHLSAFRMRKHYTLDLSALSTANFYPVTFGPSYDELDCEIHSPNASGAAAYNQNHIHFLLTTRGWTDTKTRIIVLTQGNFDDNEITIGAIGRGNREGERCVWLRGGLVYRVTSNSSPVLRTSDYTYSGEVFRVGTDITGGANENVTVLWRNDDTRDGNKAATLGSNVASATKLQTSRKINGTLFNGTADIVTSCWGVTRSLWGQSCDGSGNVSGSLKSVTDITMSGKLLVGDGTSTDHHTAIEIWPKSSWAGRVDKHSSIVFKDGTANTSLVAAIGAGYNGSQQGYIDFHSMYNGAYKTDTDIVMRICGTGRIGIGVTAPAHKLDVNGDAKVRGTFYAGGTALTVPATGSITHSLSIVPSANNNLRLGSDTMNYAGVHSRQLINNTENVLWIWQAKNYQARIATAGTSRLTVTAAGGVIIGGEFNMDEDRPGVLRCTEGVYSDGFVSAKGVSTSSDARLKRINHSIYISVRDIAEAPSVDFVWERDGVPDVGSIAQYWQAIDRRLAPEGPGGYLTLQYGKTALLGLISVARTTMSHEERLTKLERENACLKEETIRLRQQIAELKPNKNH